MATETTHFTADDLFRLPPGQGMIELLDGELVRMSPTGDSHGSVAAEFLGFLAPFVRQNKLGRTYTAEAGFILSTNPDTVFCPDVGFVRAVRLGSGRRPRSLFRGAPDLAVEVISPSDRLADVEEKIGRYLTAGTSVVVLLRPEQETATIYRAQAAAVVMGRDQELTIPDLLPGLTIPLSEIFW